MSQVDIRGESLHVVEGINYSCSGCGRCCHNIVVPMTDEDYERVSVLDFKELIPEYMGEQLFRQTRDHESEGTAYSHVILRNSSGHCPFLVDKLCSIHGKYGAEIKPVICQLFPYCFNETPTGIFVTVSFRSTAVLFNQGDSLTSQMDVLADRLAKYRALYPGKRPNWDEMKLTVNQPLSWDSYLELESRLLEILSDKAVSLDKRMIACSRFLKSQVAGASVGSADQSAEQSYSNGETPPLKRLDKCLLSALHRLYFPAEDKVSRAAMSFSVLGFVNRVILGMSSLKLATRSFQLDEIKEFPWPENDPEIEDLLYRFLHSRIFGKWYFGGGYWQLSLIAGFNHLAICMALLKAQSKASAIARNSALVEFIDVAHSVRRLEEQLSEVEISPYAAGIFELLMFSPDRLNRIIASL